MKMNYPYSDFAGVLRLTRLVVESGNETTVNDAATSLGLSSVSANFKYRILAARLLGLLMRREDRLTATELGRRIIRTDRRPADVKTMVGKVTAFSNLPAEKEAADGITDEHIGAVLRSAGVPEARVSKVTRFYRELAAYESISGAATPGKDVDCSTSALAPAVEHRPGNIDSDASGSGWLLFDETLKALLAKAPRDASSWSEARRENFISCVDSLLRELLWRPD